MSKLLEFRKRLNVIENVDKIVKAMQTITLGKLHRSQISLKISRNYLEVLTSIILENFEELKPFNNVFNFGDFNNKNFKKNLGQKVLLVLFSAERSFSGDFTEKIFSKAIEFVKENPEKQFFYLPIGLKGRAIVKNKGWPMVEVKNFSEIPNFLESCQLAEEILKRFKNKEFEEVFFIYNYFRSLLFQEPIIERIFPFPEALNKTKKPQKWFFYEPNLAEVAEEIFLKYLKIKVYQLFYESYASELAARIFNLRSASETSRELIKSLTLQINKARQARITEELTEIISSYEVIREEN